MKITVKESFRIPGTDITIKEGQSIETIVEGNILRSGVDLSEAFVKDLNLIKEEVSKGQLIVYALVEALKELGLEEEVLPEIKDVIATY